MCRGDKGWGWEREVMGGEGREGGEGEEVEDFFQSECAMMLIFIPLRPVKMKEGLRLSHTIPLPPRYCCCCCFIGRGRGRKACIHPQRSPPPPPLLLLFYWWGRGRKDCTLPPHHPTTPIVVVLLVGRGVGRIAPSHPTLLLMLFLFYW